MTTARKKKIKGCRQEVLGRRLVGGSLGRKSLENIGKTSVEKKSLGLRLQVDVITSVGRNLGRTLVIN